MPDSGLRERPLRGGEGYFTLAVEGQQWRGLRSFPTLKARYPPGRTRFAHVDGVLALMRSLSHFRDTV